MKTSVSQEALSTLTASQLAKKMVDATGLEPVTPCV
ncbi:hypothetical protein M2103_001585 [Ereboglobus sp. PH5-5]|nr:hypothetical protein [Ereboglobus sp. PH5-5]